MCVSVVGGGGGINDKSVFCFWGAGGGGGGMLVYERNAQPRNGAVRPHCYYYCYSSSSGN